MRMHTAAHTHRKGEKRKNLSGWEEEPSPAIQACHTVMGLRLAEV
jgi:hypothetical protein